jgi:NADPH-dependent glutamate synthase beta subunit-like oxidoreductase
VLPGRREAQADPGSEFVIKADLAFIAIGFAGPAKPACADRLGAR